MILSNEQKYRTYTKDPEVRNSFFSIEPDKQYHTGKLSSRLSKAKSNFLLNIPFIDLAIKQKKKFFFNHFIFS